MHEYVEEMLSPHFGGMIKFVKDCERLLEHEQIDQLKAEERELHKYVLLR